MEQPDVIRLNSHRVRFSHSDLVSRRSGGNRYHLELLRAVLLTILIRMLAVPIQSLITMIMRTLVRTFLF